LYQDIVHDKNGYESRENDTGQAEEHLGAKVGDGVLQGCDDSRDYLVQRPVDDAVGEIEGQMASEKFVEPVEAFLGSADFVVAENEFYLLLEAYDDERDRYEHQKSDYDDYREPGDCPVFRQTVATFIQGVEEIRENASGGDGRQKRFDESIKFYCHDDNNDEQKIKAEFLDFHGFAALGCRLYWLIGHAVACLT
jgi:hypothetical protein